MQTDTTTKRLAITISSITSPKTETIVFDRVMTCFESDPEQFALVSYPDLFSGSDEWMVIESSDFADLTADLDAFGPDTLKLFWSVACAHYELSIPVDVVVSMANIRGASYFTAEFLQDVFCGVYENAESFAYERFESIPGGDDAIALLSKGIFGHECDAESLLDFAGLGKSLIDLHYYSKRSETDQQLYIFAQT